MPKEEHRYWVALKMVPEIGRKHFHLLLEHFGSPEAALGASEKALRSIPGFGDFIVSALLHWQNYVDVDAEFELMELHGVEGVCLEDPEYPANLREMPLSPPFLYYKGTLEEMDRASVAVIGTRKMSRYGKDAAWDIVSDLAKAGITIVSGLALGLDSESHRAALKAGGRTLAVLGNGLCHIYPAQHRQLAESVVAQGALISEMPMDARPDAGSFPQRNAIIAGLSLGVLVLEAGAKSGTTITARHALESNRSVYAVPGDIGRANSLGTNRLIQEGAQLVTCGRDILADLRSQLEPFLPDLADAAFEPPRKPGGSLSALEKMVYEALSLDALSIDALTEKLLVVSAEPLSVLREEEPEYGGSAPPALRQEEKITYSKILAALLSLEMKGLVRQEPGKMFHRVR